MIQKNGIKAHANYAILRGCPLRVKRTIQQSIIVNVEEHSGAKKGFTISPKKYTSIFKEMLTMKIDKKDAALILKLGGKIEIAIPKSKGDDLVSNEALFVAAIAMLLQERDKDFLRIINKQIKKMIKETKEDV